MLNSLLALPPFLYLVFAFVALLLVIAWILLPLILMSTNSHFVLLLTLLGITTKKVAYTRLFRSDPMGNRTPITRMRTLRPNR